MKLLLMVPGSGTARPRLGLGVGQFPDFGGSKLGSKRKLEGL